jgi:two-component system, NarL family, response regulator NreC
VPPRTELREVILPVRRIRCVLTHGHVLFRQGLRRLLEDEPDLEVVGEAGNAAECLRKVYEVRPHVLVVDSETFALPAAEAELLVARESPQTKIVFLSLREPASGDSQDTPGDCAVRHTSSEELVEMVRRSCGGEATDQGRAALHTMDHREASSGRRGSTPERALTARERDVLKLLAQGKTVRMAAIVLGLSSKTVDAHKFNLMRKLGIHNKAELVMWAIQRRVVKIPANF